MTPSCQICVIYKPAKCQPGGTKFYIMRKASNWKGKNMKIMSILVFCWESHTGKNHGSGPHFLLHIFCLFWRLPWLTNMPSGASVVRTQIFISPACQLGKDINFFEFLLGPRLSLEIRKRWEGIKKTRVHIQSRKWPRLGQIFADRNHRPVVATR